MNLRQLEIVTDKDKLQVDIQATCMKYKTIKQWAYILHDQDDTRPHYHIYLNFGTAVNTKLICDWFKIEENFIEKVKGRKTDILLYLTHGNDTQQHKHQYDSKEVVSNFNFELEIEQEKILGNFKEHSYAKQIKYITTLPISEKSQALTKLKKLWELECLSLSMQTDRNITVIFITGKAGCGKTYYAKKMLDEQNYDYCISSSSNDPFQDYMGQDAIILDDLRHTDFEMPDLLKILDNNTSSSVKSRFNNKVFNGKLIIITSSVPLNYWYPEHRSSHDSLKQLYRRINTYISVSENYVTLYDSIGDDGRPKGTGATYYNELKDKPKKIVKTDVQKIFNKFAEYAHSFGEQIKIEED